MREDRDRQAEDEMFQETRDENKEDQGTSKWWPLLLLPIAFFIGWAGNAMVNDTTTTNPQVGIGGGPQLTPCPTSDTGL